MAEGIRAKWEGKATAVLTGPSADQVWPFLADFCALDKLLPLVETCQHVGGPIGELGQIRRAASGSWPLSSDGERWVEEKLVAIDPIGRWLSFEVGANNMGIKSYVGTMKVVTPSDGKGCAIEWSFACDPIEGRRFEDFLGYIEMGVKAMGKKMEEALQ